MIGVCTILITNALGIHHRFIKPLAKREMMQDAVRPFSFHQPYPFVERLMKV